MSGTAEQERQQANSPALHAHHSPAPDQWQFGEHHTSNPLGVQPSRSRRCHQHVSWCVRRCPSASMGMTNTRCRSGSCKKGRSVPTSSLQTVLACATRSACPWVWTMVSQLDGEGQAAPAVAFAEQSICRCCSRMHTLNQAAGGPSTVCM